MTLTLSEVQVLADRLAPREQALLIAHLSQRLATHIAPQAELDGWQRLDQLRAEFAALAPSRPRLAEQLDRDRRYRI